MNSHFTRSLIRTIVLLSILWMATSPVRAKERDCTGLMELELPDGGVTAAEIITDGIFAPPGSGMTLEDLPDFCRVTVTVEPAINIEVWLPVENWNGKFNGVGLMGYSGAVNYNALAPPLRRGYAVASTDGGHKSSPRETRWAIGNPEAIISLGHRAHHEMTVRAKNVIRAYYGSESKYSYFTGCSAGGWQALTEAQRYPGDYDGIVSGGPVFNLIHLHAGSLWNAIQARAIKPEKFNLFGQAVLAACDAEDGVADGMIEHPPACKFDPATLACPAEEDGDCLTADEIASFKNIIRGLRNSADTQIYPGWPVSTVGGMALWKNQDFINLTEGTFRDLVYQGERDWSLETMDFDVDVPRADAVLGPHFNSNNPNLLKFKQRGGKLILHHGWNDPLVSVYDTIDYYHRVAAATGQPNTAGTELIQDFSRLFLAPAMGHCALLPGPGPYRHDALVAMERWVEHGEAPDKLIVSNPETGISKPLCPYPQVAGYMGSGSTGEAASFECVVPTH